MDETSDSTLTFEELSEAFLARLKAGEAPSVEEYARAHPEHAEEIAEAFPAMLALERVGTEQEARRELTRIDTGLRDAGFVRLGDYRVVRRIGRGGMGVVYEAVQESLDRRVALKVLAAELTASEASRRRFRREAEAAGRLYHTNIVPVYGVGHHRHLQYYVMQYINGVGLDAVLRELPRHCRQAPEYSGAGPRATGDHPSPAATAARALAKNYWRNVAGLGLQVAQALAHAHQHGVTHRDIKPSNLLLDREGRVWVTDFGLAKHESAETVTKTGAIIGTLRYMAPEQFNGQADPRSDVHSLGLTLYELLTLAPAYPESGAGDLVRLKTTTEPPEIRSRSLGIPQDLVTIVQKACALDPDHRFQTASELAEDLECFLGDRPIRARSATPLERLWRWGRRNPAVALLTGLAAALLLAVALVSTIGYVCTTRALGEANDERARAEANLNLALEAFSEIMGAISMRGVPRALALDSELEGAASAPALPNAADVELLQNLLAFFYRFAEQNQADLDVETAEVYQRMGDIHRRLGQPDRAREAYRQALQVRTAFFDRSPGDPANALAYARLLNAMGLLEKETGELQGARSVHESARDVLAAAAHTDPVVRLELARTLNLLGSTGLSRGNDSMMGAMRRRRRPAASGDGSPPGDTLDSETAAFEEARSILHDLMRLDPTNPDFKYELAQCGRSQALCALRDADTSEARRLLASALADLESLARDFPDVPLYQYELADTLCYQVPGRHGVAPVFEDHADRAVAIAGRLSARYPWMVGYQALLATALTRQASVREDTGRLEEAETGYRDAVARFRDLAEQQGSTAYEVACAKALHGLGDVLREQGRPGDSQDALEEAISMIEAHGRSRQPAYRGLLGRLDRSLVATLRETDGR